VKIRPSAHAYRKITSNPQQTRVVEIGMNRNSPPFRRCPAVDYATTAVEQMEQYCTAHPDSPSAVRHPQLFFRSDLWIALLGPSVEEGIVGIGSTVSAALRAFDVQYIAGLHPPGETITPLNEKSAMVSQDNASKRKLRLRRALV
jgi:hypothetical protein